jgi:hypothetical protein
VLARTSSNQPGPTQRQGTEAREALCCTLLHFGPFYPQRGCTQHRDGGRPATSQSLAGRHWSSEEADHSAAVAEVLNAMRAHYGKKIRS